MHIKNFEFKAKIEAIEPYETQLLTLNPKYIGLDHQIDTYFRVDKGRLKLREGNIENALIQYEREDIQGSKQSNVILYQHLPNKALKDILTEQFGVKIVVDKRRKIYFIDNVKFHFDTVEHLGTFLEVEAIDNQNAYSITELQVQCDAYFNFFGLAHHQIIPQSYSDLLMQIDGNDC
ncbi:MAG: class IV adenylate cyclase [Saprospiraceae bacterium]